MKKTLLAFLLFCVTNAYCQNINLLYGTYKFIAFETEPRLNLNQYMVFGKTKDGRQVGRFYATTDEFVDAREGYLPGYFVATMDSIEVKQDSLFL